MKRIYFLLFIFLLTTACASTSNLGVVTKSQADPTSLLTSSQSFEEIGRVRGKACRFFLVGVIPWGDSTVTRAIDNALQSGGDAIINVSVTSSLYGFVPIYNIFCFTCTEVEGIAIAFTEQ
jgi:hypothetical protein